MLDTWGDPVIEGPYYCNTCHSGDHLAIDDAHDDVSVVYCLICGDIVHLHEV